MLEVVAAASSHYHYLPQRQIAISLILKADSEIKNSINNICQRHNVREKEVNLNITEFSVKGLFGIFDHTIPLTNNDNVTVIHGPNGIGKTMLLRLIKGFVAGEIGILEEIPFIEFSAKRSDGLSVTLKSNKMRKETGEKGLPSLELFVTSATPLILESMVGFYIDIPSEVLDDLDGYVHYTYTRHGAGWEKSGESKTYYLHEMIKLYPNLEKYTPQKYKAKPFSFFTNDTNVFYVETIRLSAEKRPTQDYDLFAEDENDETLRVKQYSKDISSRIELSLADYAKYSQELDRTFPQRLVNFLRDGSPAFESKKIIFEINQLNTLRKRLIKLGLLDSESILSGINEEDVKRCSEALTIYIQDMQEKLSVFDKIAKQLGSLVDIIKNRFKYKQLTLHRTDGFRFKSITGNTIEASDLSSGEQHELVLLYELIFRIPEQSLILIDEPEISLHVAWQASFLDDLMSMLKTTHSYGIVATHSPTLIGPRWDLTTELTGPEIPDFGEEK